MKQVKNILLLVIFMLFVSKTLEADIILGPYPQAVTQNSAIIMLECNNTEPVSCLFNIKGEKTTRIGSSEYKKISANTFVFKLYLENLKPGTEYGLKAAQRGMDEATNSIYFSTLASAGNKFTFSIMGNTKGNSELASKLATTVKAYKPSFSLFLGDIASSPAYKSLKGEFFTKEMIEYIQKSPFFNAVGKGEGWKENTQAFTCSPKLKDKNVESSNNDPYYSFEAGDACFLVLSTETDMREGSKQWEFAKNTLAQTNKKWKIVSFNAPAFCSQCNHFNKQMQEASKELFSEYNVNLVLTSTDDAYEHIVANNIHYLLISSVGTMTQSQNNNDKVANDENKEMRLETGKQQIIKTEQGQHFAISEVSSKELVITVYSAANTEVEKIIIN